MTCTDRLRRTDKLVIESELRNNLKFDITHLIIIVAVLAGLAYLYKSGKLNLGGSTNGQN